MSEKRVKPDLEAIQSALSSLQPTESRGDRDRVMYRAGQAASGAVSVEVPRRRAGWTWPCATAASLLVAVTFAGMWLSRGEPEVRIVYRDRAVAVPEGPDKAVEAIEVADDELQRKSWRSDYLRLRRLVTTDGVGAMPEDVAPPPGDVEVLRWGSGFQWTLDELLEG